MTHIVFIITRSDSFGGAHVHVRDLSRELRRRGNEVTVLVGGGGSYVAQLVAAGCQVRTLRHLVRPISPMRDVRGFFEIRRHLRELAPDLVSTHSSKAGWLGRLAAASLGIPALFTAHGWAFTEGVRPMRRRLYRLAEAAIAPLSRRIITVSEQDRQLARRLGVGSDSQLITVHNGMPDIGESLRADPRRNPARVIMVARFDEQKDHGTLIAALAQLKDMSWELELIGDGPLAGRARETVRAAGLQSRVTFLGARNDVAARLAMAQVFVLATHWEGFPRSILEAMRAGLPVVASDVGGVNESVTDSRTGSLVQRRDVAGMRDSLRRLLADPELRANYGAAGRTRYDECFRFELMVERTVDVYRTVLPPESARFASPP